MNLNYASIPNSAKSSVEALALWCIEQLAARNAGVQVREREASISEAGLEFAAGVSKFRNPEGQNLVVARMTLKLPADYELSRSWEVAQQISTGDVYATFY